jgi:two-component system phosphate regulon sensor histidine kinase PhoR
MQTGRWRTFWRLFATYLVVVLTTIGLLGWIVVYRVDRYEREQIEASLHVKALLVEEALRDSPDHDVKQLSRRLAELPGDSDLRITLLDARGGVLADSVADHERMENHLGRPEVVAARTNGTGSATHLSRTLGVPTMYAARRTTTNPSVAYVRVGRPLDSVQRQVAELTRLVWAFAAVAALAVLFMAFWLARRISRPLSELTVGAERIAAGDYGHKVYAIRQDEFGALAKAFNAMSERLANQFRQVEEDRQKLRTVLSGMVEGVVAIDAEQRVLFANDRAAQLLDFPAERVVGRKLWEVVRQRAIQEVVGRAQENAEPYREELDWNGPAVKSLAVYVARLHGPPDVGAVLVLHDTTELRRLERLRQDFVANVSHELKTPLSVIKASIETLLDGAIDDPENRGAFLEQIDEQATRLHMLILDLLSLARIESGAEAFDFRAVPVEPVVAACVDKHRARAEAKGQQLQAVGSIQRVSSGQWAVGRNEKMGSGQQAVNSNEKQHDSQQPDHAALPTAYCPLPTVTAWADEEAVSQILDNLVDNAVKYTPSGGSIWVRWRADERQVCMEVEDTGIGIPERDLPRIFERFYRVDKARSRELGGTGLGLSIVKHLVVAMNGTVSASSRLNQGTTFIVRLPRAPST